MSYYVGNLGNCQAAISAVNNLIGCPISLENGYRMNSWASESFEIVPIEGVSGTYAFESVRLSIYQHYSINETAIEAFVSNFVENKLTTVESVVRA